MGLVKMSEMHLHWSRVEHYNYNRATLIASVAFLMLWLHFILHSLEVLRVEHYMYGTTFRFFCLNSLDISELNRV